MTRYVVDVRRQVVQYEKGCFVIEAPDVRTAHDVAIVELQRGEVLDNVEWATIDKDFKAATVETVIVSGRDPPKPRTPPWATS